MALPDERCAEGGDGMLLSEIRQVPVEDREIDIQQMIRRGRNLVIKCTVAIDNRIDAWRSTLRQSAIVGEMKRSPASST